MQNTETGVDTTSKLILQIDQGLKHAICRVRNLVATRRSKKINVISRHLPTSPNPPRITRLQLPFTCVLIFLEILSLEINALGQVGIFEKIIIHNQDIRSTSLLETMVDPDIGEAVESSPSTMVDPDIGEAVESSPSTIDLTVGNEPYLEIVDPETGNIVKVPSWIIDPETGEVVNIPPWILDPPAWMLRMNPDRKQPLRRKVWAAIAISSWYLALFSGIGLICSIIFMVSYLALLMFVFWPRESFHYVLRPSHKQLIESAFVFFCSCWAYYRRDGGIWESAVGLSFCFCAIAMLNLWLFFDNFGFWDCCLIILIDVALVCCRNRGGIIFTAVAVVGVAMQVLKNAYRQYSSRKIKNEAEEHLV